MTKGSDCPLLRTRIRYGRPRPVSSWRHRHTAPRPFARDPGSRVPDPGFPVDQVLDVDHGCRCRPVWTKSRARARDPTFPCGPETPAYGAAAERKIGSFNCLQVILFCALSHAIARRSSYLKPANSPFAGPDSPASATGEASSPRRLPPRTRCRRSRCRPRTDT